jgi:chitodextrinase
MKKTILFSILAVALLVIGFRALADAPLTPINITATSTTPTSVNLAWSASSSTVYFQIFRNSTVTPIATTSAISYQDTGLSPNTAYTYYLASVDASSTVSAISAGFPVTTQADVTAPSIPTGLTAIPASQTQINLAWATSTDNVAVAGYAVYRDSVAIATTTVGSFNDTGLSSTTVYTYNIVAFDAANNRSAFSAGASATPQTDSSAPTQPTGLNANPISGSQINLNWSASTDNFGVAGYLIYRDNAQVGSSITNSFSDTGLTPTTTYKYQVTALDAAGNVSPKSATTTATTLGQSGSNIFANIVVKNGDKNGKLININSNEIIKAVVLSDGTYNVRNIVFSSVRFGGAAAISRNFGFANRDRKLDGEFSFRAKEMTGLSNADTIAKFSATLKDGRTITGEAKVRVTNSKKIKRIEKLDKRIEDAKNRLAEAVKKMEQRIEQMKKRLEDLKNNTNNTVSNNNKVIKLNNGNNNSNNKVIKSNNGNDGRFVKKEEKNDRNKNNNSNNNKNKRK